jgi:hypothetical protein
MNKYFKLFWTQGGHIQFTIIKSLAVCAQKQIMNETNIDSWRYAFCWVAECGAPVLQFNLAVTKKTVGGREKLLTYLNSVLKGLLGADMFPHVPKQS